LQIKKALDDGQVSLYHKIARALKKPVQLNIIISLIQSDGESRLYEVTATPAKEGANLSEQSNNKRI